MRKRIQQLSKDEKGYVHELSAPFLIIISVIIFLCIELYGNLGNDFTDKPVKPDPRIEFMDILRDIEVKVEAGNVTKVDKQAFDNVSYSLPHDFPIELKTKLSETLEKLIENPSDAYLKRVMTETLNQTKQYVIDYEF